jgi:hypothetical protein
MAVYVCAKGNAVEFFLACKLFRCVMHKNFSLCWIFDENAMILLLVLPKFTMKLLLLVAASLNNNLLCYIFRDGNNNVTVIM